MRARVAIPGGRELVIDDAMLSPLKERLDGASPRAPVRLAYAAAHIVMRPSYARVKHSITSPGDPAVIADHIDWGATLAIRRRLDAMGLGVAEAMDTAQRFSIGWGASERLIRSCGQLRLDNGFIAGAGADQLCEIPSHAHLVDAVVEQASVIQEAGGIVMLLPLPSLSRNAAAEEAYVDVYEAIIRALPGPLCIHWLGESFLPDLAGYFPGESFSRIMALDPGKVRACKLSLLDAARELRIRRELLPRDQFVLTGDDFNFASLIIGEGAQERVTEFGGRVVGLGDFSHALLGILDGIAEPASLALRALAQGEGEICRDLLQSCEDLARVVFERPTMHYKAGLAFISWLNGWQDTFLLANHEQRARDRNHYARVAALAAEAGALTDADLAAGRLETWFDSTR